VSKILGSYESSRAMRTSVREHLNLLS